MSDLAWAEYAARMFEPQTPRWETPGDLAKHIDPRVIQTPALDLIDQALTRTLATPDGRLIISMPPQEGKLVADDTMVPTPTGWTKHGDLREGDYVLHPSGRPVRVLEVHPPSLATLRVHTSDGGHVDVHPAHEWTVHDRGTGTWKTLETRQLAAARLSHGEPGKRGHKYRFHLPLRDAFDLPTADLPVDPYTLGVWLGDGSTTKGAITHHPDDHYCIPYRASARHVHATTGVVTTYYEGLRTDLRRAGVLGAKHIPPAYLRASEAQRRALLAGLLDSDGHVGASGQVTFDNANRELVQSVAELIRSLGYRAGEHRPTPPKLSSSGIQGKLEMWRVAFTPHDQGPARLARKGATQLGRRERVAITRVEHVPPRPGRCITVDAPDGLYLVGEHMTPTHNSQRASRAFPLWALTQNPDLRIAITSYEANVARRWGRAIRDDIRNTPDLDLSIRDDLSAQHEWALEARDGGVYTAGVGGALTGRPVDLLIIDDPVKDREQADSPTYRDKVWGWWTDTARTRLAPGAPVILILTRWHEDDLAGRLLSDEDGDTWQVLSIPAQCENPDTDPLGRELGQYMTSARGRTQQQWDAIKAGSPSRTWAALYQQNPVPAEGAVWKAPWIDLNKARAGDVLHRLARVVVAVDPAAKSKKTSDLTGIIVAGLDTQGHAWVLDDRTLRGTPIEWGMAAWDALLDWRGGELIVEDNQGGEMVQEVMRTAWHTVKGRRAVTQLAPPVRTVTATQSKRTRAESVAAYYEAGRVHHAADGTDRLHQLEQQMLSWTGDGTSPDRIDALVHALTVLFAPNHSGAAIRPRRRDYMR